MNSRSGIVFILSLLMTFGCLVSFSYADDIEPGIEENDNQPEITEELTSVDGESDSDDILNGWQEVVNEDGTVDKYYYIDNVPVTGLQTIDGACYYFDPDGVMHTGWQTIDGDRYYFKLSGVMKTGWLTTKDGKRYHFRSNGVMHKGLVTIDSYRYYFNSYGVMRKGTVKYNGNLYYFSTKTGKGVTNKGFFTGSDGKVRYALGYGKIAQGIRTINGKGYVFYKSSGAKRTVTGWYDIDGKHVYTRKGILVKGWNISGSKAFFCYRSGEHKYEQAKGTTVKYLKVPKSGFLGEAYVLGIRKLNNTGWTLENAYKNSYKLKYAHRWMRKDSSEEYAVYAFKNNKGNCYCMAATFYIQAKLLGYNVRQIEGKVNKYYPHSWTQIKQDGKWWVYDPNFKNETGRNGWKIYYGKKGTWRYMNYHVFQY